jgi:antitoxin YefM
MSILNATEARSKLYALIDETKETHKPILITGKRGNAILLAEEDWNAISETLYLVSMPGLRESIREGLATDLADTDQTLDW